VVSAGKRVLVVGTGSVGIRHIENLLELDAEVSIVSMRSGRVGELAKRYPVKPYDDLQEALGTKPDAVVIANRTDQHIATALPVAACGIDIFMEKPLSNDRVYDALSPKPYSDHEVTCRRCCWQSVFC